MVKDYGQFSRARKPATGRGAVPAEQPAQAMGGMWHPAVVILELAKGLPMADNTLSR